MEGGPGATSYSFGAVPRIPSSLSVAAVDVVFRATCASSPSPAASLLTLTPGRTRNLDQDMQALRLSRQDNPFLQVLASRESLIDGLEESESDDANLMSQEFPDELDIDPLTLPEIHEHMIRSPPPITWPKSPNFKVFRFPLQTSDDDSSQESLHQCGKRVALRRSRGSLDGDRCPDQTNPWHDQSDSWHDQGTSSFEAARRTVAPRVHHRSCSDTRDRGALSLLSPESLRLLKRSADDAVQLMPGGRGSPLNAKRQA